MDNRDNLFEQQIRSGVENIPESLRPENMERRLSAMSQDERYNRSQSTDIPDDAEFEKIASKKKKSGKRKVVLPIAIAASVLLAAGVGAFFLLRKSGATKDTEIKGLGTTPEQNAEEVDSDENYKKAYRLLKDYKRNYVDVMYDVDYVEEADAESEAGGETLKAMNSAGATEASREASTGNEDYTDTNVRTEGVSEADIIKTDGKYIYAYEEETEHIIIYSVDNGEVSKIGTANVLEDDFYFEDMYINGDKLILMGVYDNNRYSYRNNETCISIYDISDRTNPKLDKRIKQDGYYNSSRMVGSVLYTFSRKSFDLDKIKKRKYESYIPEVDGEVMANSELIVQEDSYTDTFIVVSSVDVNEAKVIDKMAILGGSDTLYVSSENIYLADRTYNWDSFGYDDDTRLVKISYSDGDFKYEAEGDFPGYLNDDYSIDEYEGNVRIVSSYRDSNYTQYNGLFILDENLKQRSVIKKLAEGETIRSARFMGKAAYFVTFRNMDPLFAVDLSDPDNPRVTDYLKIPGFSAYMHPYGDNLLLGIGYDFTTENQLGGSIKLSMFDVSDPFDIKELDTKILYNYNSASVLNDRRAFMFNEKDGTFGFSTGAMWVYYDDDAEWYEEYYGDEYTDWADNVDFDTEGLYYEVYDYDENKGFECKMDEKLEGLYSSVLGTRGIVIGDYLYVIQSGNGIKSYDTENYKLYDECD